MNIHTSFWTVCVSNDCCKENFMIPNNIICDCPIFSKEFVCKHFVYIAVNLEFISVPDNAKSIPISEKRKRGRPTLARRAFLTQQ